MRIKIALSFFLGLWLVPGPSPAAPAGESDWLRPAGRSLYEPFSAAGATSGRSELKISQ